MPWTISSGKGEQPQEPTKEEITPEAEASGTSGTPPFLSGFSGTTERSDDWAWSPDTLICAVDMALYWCQADGAREFVIWLRERPQIVSDLTVTRVIEGIRDNAHEHDCHLW